MYEPLPAPYDIRVVGLGCVCAVLRRAARAQGAGQYDGSLAPTFVSAWLVGLTVKLAYALALSVRFPSELSQPLNASATL